MRVGSEEGALVPKWDPDAGRYDWRAPDPVAAIEPAFIREAVVSEFDPEARNVEVRAPVGVTTFADVYPRGTQDHAATEAPSPDADFDPLEDWRVTGDVADDILINLPESTPKMLRTLMTLLMGAMRRK